jgi:hypothetical protein
VPLNPFRKRNREHRDKPSLTPLQNILGDDRSRENIDAHADEIAGLFERDDLPWRVVWQRTEHDGDDER